MGLVKAVLGSALGSIYDQWKEFIYCDSIPNEVLLTKGRRRVDAISGNDNGSPNVITDGSKVVLNDGQFMIVVENGQIIDFSSEPGGYIWNTGAEPGLFSEGMSGFFENFKNAFKERLKSGGQAMNDQRVYFVNMKEIRGNRFGFGNVSYRDSEFNLTIMLSGFGTYSLKIVNPIDFYTNITGNVPGDYLTKTLVVQLRSELQAELIPLIGAYSGKGLKYDELPANNEKIAFDLLSKVNEKWKEKRGVELSSLVFTQITPDDKSLEKIRQLQEVSAYSGQSDMMDARMGVAQANAMESAGENKNGAAFGFAGFNMAMNAGPYNMSRRSDEASGNANKKEDQAGKTDEGQEWTCECGEKNTLRFCINCGKPMPKDNETWVCECGHKNIKNFCASCGKPKPKRIVCDKCGYEIGKMDKVPRFCPQCGDPIDEKDMVD